MIEKEQLKKEIDMLDDRDLEWLAKIIRQLPPNLHTMGANVSGADIAAQFKDIADNGGLGISDPVAWQREIRQERALPFRKT